MTSAGWYPSPVHKAGRLSAPGGGGSNFWPLPLRPFEFKLHNIFFSFLFSIIIPFLREISQTAVISCIWQIRWECWRHKGCTRSNGPSCWSSGPSREAAWWHWCTDHAPEWRLFRSSICFIFASCCFVTNSGLQKKKRKKEKKTNKDKQISTYELWLTDTGTGTDIGTRMNGRGIAPAEPSECEDARKELLLTRDESRQLSCR